MTITCVYSICGESSDCFVVLKNKKRTQAFKTSAEDPEIKHWFQIPACFLCALKPFSVPVPQFPPLKEKTGEKYNLNHEPVAED